MFSSALRNWAKVQECLVKFTSVIFRYYITVSVNWKEVFMLQGSDGGEVEAVERRDIL